MMLAPKTLHGSNDLNFTLGVYGEVRHEMALAAWSHIFSALDRAYEALTLPQLWSFCSLD